MKALLLIDIQNDFCPGGALAVPDGDAIVSVVNRLSGKASCVIQTQDWHPSDHSSFASNHEDKDPYNEITMNYGTQVLWPDHCVQGTEGADFHPELEQNRSQLIVRKGFRPHIDSYSAFFENDHETPTGLHGYLQERGTKELYLAGLATDFCVKWSALDARKLGYKVHLISDAVRGIDLNGSVDQAMTEMEEAGVLFTDSKQAADDLE